MVQIIKILFFTFVLIIVKSCTTVPPLENDGIIINGKVEFNGHENNKLFIKIYRDSLYWWDPINIANLNPKYIVDSIEIEENGTYVKYLQNLPYEDRYILLINNASITSNVEVVYREDTPECTKDFYLQKYSCINLSIRRNVPSEKNVEVLIYSGNYLKYEYNFNTSLIDTSFTNKIIKGDCAVTYNVYQSSLDEFEKYTFSKSFYEEYSDTLYYSINLTEWNSDINLKNALQHCI